MGCHCRGVPDSLGLWGSPWFMGLQLDGEKSLAFHHCSFNCACPLSAFFLPLDWANSKLSFSQGHFSLPEETSMLCHTSTSPTGLCVSPLSLVLLLQASTMGRERKELWTWDWMIRLQIQGSSLTDCITLGKSTKNATLGKKLGFHLFL